MYFFKKNNNKNKVNSQLGSFSQHSLLSRRNAQECALVAARSVQLFGAVCANNERSWLSPKGLVALVSLSLRCWLLAASRLGFSEDIHRHLVGMMATCNSFTSQRLLKIQEQKQ